MTTMSSRNSFYFPASISSLQKEFIELLLLLHKETLLLQLPKMDQEWNGERQEMDSFELFTMNAQLAGQNPYLLLHHYIPKKFILMESKELFLFGSGKFRAFQRFIDAFLLQTEPIDIIVVASSHKELDLIEGFITGQKLICKRYTGTPLHNNSDASSGKEKVVKDEDHVTRSSRHKNRSKEQKPLPVTLHLMSTSRLYRGLDRGMFPRLKIVLSFDAMLSEDQPSVESLRKQNDRIVPLVKIVALNSMDHVLLADPNRNPFEAANVLLSNREMWRVFPPSWAPVNEKSISKWLNGESHWFYPDNLPSLNPMMDLAELSTAISTCGLAGTSFFDLSDFHLEHLDFVNYNANLRRLIDKRSQQMSVHIDVLGEKLSTRRAEESVSQAEIEETNVKVAECFKKIQALNVEANNEEKKLERLDSQFSAQKETESSLSNILLDGSIEDVADLEKELEILKQENSKVAQENEQLREKYQAASSLAADCSMRVKRVSNECASLQSQLDGPALKLKRLVDTSVKINLENELGRLKSNTGFIETYSVRLSKMVKEKQSSYVSPYVGTRSGRASRASTPKMR